MAHPYRTLRLALLSVALLASLCASPALAQENGPGVRLVIWQPKPGMAHDFEEGYKRHLEWHRNNKDSWTWLGWTVASGDRTGYFIDATFSHPWTDFDSPVSPAADSADNAVHVIPYADVRLVTMYEALPGQTPLSLDGLESPLLTFDWFAIAPGHAPEFESLVNHELAQVRPQPSGCILLRPVNGATEYLLLLPARKQSELHLQAGFLSQLLGTVSQKERGAQLVLRVRTETARHRPDMSYHP